MSEIVARDMGLVLREPKALWNPNLPHPPDESLLSMEFVFNGAWVPDEDPSKIGRNNFADLQNFRYTNSGLEGVQGYTRLTTTPLARTALRSGIHFRPTMSGIASSIVLAQAFNAPFFTTSAVYQHLAIIPAAGDFAATALWTDSVGAGLGRFTAAPDGNVVYCNGMDTMIWGGSQHRLGAFINYDQPLNTFRFDVTERMLNTAASTASVITLTPDGAGAIWLLIGSTRPLQGIRFVVAVANTAVSTSTVEYWDGTTWASPTGFVDGTSFGPGTATLGQTGSMTFNSTAAVAHVKFEDDRLLYFYRVNIGATGIPDATIELAPSTVDMPFQAIVDVWDGVLRTPTLCIVNSKDYTLEVLEASATNPPDGVDPFAANLNGLTAGQAMLVGFEERATAIQVRLIAGFSNAAGATLTVKYWNGTAWAAVTGLNDTTVAAGASFSISGTVSWDAPDADLEYKQTLFGRTGFVYQFTWSATLSAADIFVDLLTGVPAQRWNAQNPILGYSFPFTFAGRVMLANRPGTNELNRIDYCAVVRPDVWNGEQSSDFGKEIFIGDQTALTSAIEMANRFAGNLTATCVVHKASETWLMQGNSPETFTLFRMSDSVGNPAPLSLTIAEMPFAVDQQAIRTVALWCSAKGPMMTEGSVLLPMRFQQPDGSISSVDVYFRPTEQDSRGVNTAAFAAIRGWYDPQWSEYNLLVPSGAGQFQNTAWLVCDLRRRKWYRKVPTAYPQMVIPVEDSTGQTYIYAGVDTGHLLRLEYGTSWAGAVLDHVVDLPDIPYTENVWNVTRLRYLKLLAVAETGVAAALTCAHAGDGSGTFVTAATLALVGGSARYAKVTQSVNLLALTHQLRISLSSNDKQRAPRLLGLGVAFYVERQEIS